MRRIILFTALLTISVLSVTAQDVITTDRMHNGSFNPVPKEITSLRQPYLAVVGYDKANNYPTIDIYSKPGDDGRVISMKVPQQQSGDSYYEVAQGVKESVVIRGKFYDWFESDTTYTPSMITEMEEFIRRIFGYGEDFRLTEFLDADSMQAFVGNNLNENKYYNYEKYGNKYPLEYWGISQDSNICMYHYFGYETVYDLSEAAWTKDLEYSINEGYEEYTCYLTSFLFQDINNSFYPTTQIYASQTIFNNDSKWEYLVFDVEYHEIRNDGWEYPDGKFRRYVSRRPYYTGIRIINEEGDELARIPILDKNDQYTTYIYIKSVALIDGALYILTEEDVRRGAWESNNYDWEMYEGIYIIDPKTNKVMSISRAPSRMGINPNVIEQGGRLDIRISEPGQNDNVTVSSMSGQIIDSSDLKNGNTITFQTGAMPKGIYNVTLRGNGNPAENQRIIIR